MQSFQIQFVPGVLHLRVRNAARPFLFVLIGVVAWTGKSHAQQATQQNTYTPSNFSNVEVRHDPGTAVWPKTTRAANGTGRIPPTIIHDKNGVTAILNPSWFTKSVAKRSASGKIAVICEDDTRGRVHATHAKSQAHKTRTTQARKAVRAPR